MESPLQRNSKFRSKILCLIFSTLLILTGCFNIREPEQPLNQNASGWNSPTSPEILLENFRLAVKELNIGNYERCFHPTKFLFTPEQSLAAGNSIFFLWDLTQEMATFKNLERVKGPIANNRLEFSNIVSNNFADSCIITLNYTWTIQQNDTSFNKSNEPLVGSMVLRAVRNANQEFSFTAWQDNLADPKKLSWTSLKAWFKR